MRGVPSCILLVAVGVCLHAGCASHRAPSPADRFFLHKNARRSAPAPEAPPAPSLEETIGKIRQLMAAAHPEPKAMSATLEQRDPVLAAALKRLLVLTSDETLYDVGAAYHRAGLIDQAYQYYMRALKMNARHAASHEALARVWRDWGQPHLGLGDAHRAIYYAPDSASARNTLGTLLQAIGRREDARRAYKMAILLDAGAGYAFNNLCYLSFTEGNASQAIDECRAALRLDPALSAAHNNLALTFAAIGRLDLARREFAEAGGQTNAAYNMGIVYLAQSRYLDAANEFDTAQHTGPGLVDAERRARDARQLAEQHASGGEQ
jgi:Flp pilus assembly protein TadD